MKLIENLMNIMWQDERKLQYNMTTQYNTMAYAVKCYETGLFQYYQGVVRALFPDKPPFPPIFHQFLSNFVLFSALIFTYLEN